MAEDVLLFLKEDLPMCAFPVLEDIRRQGKLCDVTLKVGERKFTAHRIILAACIPYFHAMFTHDMVESKQDEICMQGIDPNALESLVNYAYNGKVEIDQANVQSLLVASSFLHLQAVKEACCDFLKTSSLMHVELVIFLIFAITISKVDLVTVRQKGVLAGDLCLSYFALTRLHPDNVLGVRSFADQYMCPSLVEAANKYLQKYFKEVVKTEEFVSLSMSEMTDILARDELHVHSEEQVFEAALAWVKKFEEERKNDMPELMVNVRLPLLTPQYLSDKVATEDLIKNSLKCRDLLDEAKDFHLMPERRPLLQTFKTRPRCCTDVSGIIFAVGGLTSSGDSLSTVESFDPLTGRWTVAEAMSTMRSRVGVAVLDGLLYAIGGYDGMERLSTVEVFHLETKKWKRVSSMNCKRSALGASALNKQLYVCGGYDGLSSLRSCEVYHPESDVWTMLSNMLKHRSAAGVTDLNGEIYACGGHDGLSIFDSVEILNISTNTWSITTPMLSKRCRLGVAALNGKLYAAGGYDGSVFLRSVECYDRVAKQWTALKSMNVKRSRVAMVATYGKLYAIGGYDGVTNLSSVEMYDPETDIWTIVAPMVAHEGGVGVGLLPLDPDI